MGPLCLKPRQLLLVLHELRKPPICRMAPPTSVKLWPSRCTGTTTTMERYIFKIVSPGWKWIKLFISSEEVASETMDLLLLQVHERFPGLKSSVEHNTSQVLELFTRESGQSSDPVIQAHSIDFRGFRSSSDAPTFSFNSLIFYFGKNLKMHWPCSLQEA